MLHSDIERQPRPSGHESWALWDDASLSIAPVPATPTPTLTPLPVRPAPVPFDGTGLRDAMLNVRDNLQQMGGLLDRVYAGSTERCEDYMGWYWSIVGSPTYAGVPSGWQWAYNEYIGAVEHAIETQHDIKYICDTGGGWLTALTFGVSRIGIDEAIARLGPAIDKANELLGQ